MTIYEILELDEILSNLRDEISYLKAWSDDNDGVFNKEVNDLSYIVCDLENYLVVLENFTFDYLDDLIVDKKEE